MGYLIFWILCGIAAAIAASKRGRSSLWWFILGILLGPFGLVFVLLMSPVQPAAEPVAAPTSSGEISLDAEIKKCPSCAELIKLEAMKCRFCGKEFDQEDIARQVDERRAQLMAAGTEGRIQCPSCKTWDVHQATIEGGAFGEWCPHCRKSLQEMSRL